MQKVVCLLFLFVAVFAAVDRESILICLKQHNMAQLESLVVEQVSNPSSPRYGAYLSVEELADHIGTSSSIIQELSEFLEGEGGQEIKVLPTRDYISLTLPTSIATRYEKELPHNLAEHVEFITRMSSNKAELITKENSALFTSVHHPRGSPLVFTEIGSHDMNLWIVPRFKAFQSGKAAISLVSRENSISFKHETLVTCDECGNLSSYPFKSSFDHGHFCDALGRQQPVCFTNLSLDVFPALRDHINDSWMLGVRIQDKETSLWSEEGKLEDIEGKAVAFRLIGKEWDPNSQKGVYNYSISDVVISGATQAVWGTGSYGYSESDLQKFYTDNEIPSSVSDVIGMGESGDPAGDNWVEATLDIQYLSAMAPNMKSACINTDNSTDAEGSTGFGNALLAFSAQINSNPKPPNVISMSLGSLSWASCNLLCTQAEIQGAFNFENCLSYVQSQFQVCMYSSENQVARINAEFLKMGSRGVSLFAATGDGGNHFSFGPFKTFGPNKSLAKMLNEISCNYTLPTFPAASPWVTGVGASQMVASGSTYEPIGCSTQTNGGITGGAAFSWQFDMPSYQQSVVQSYLADHASTPFGNFNAGGRAYPDISGIGAGIPIIVNNKKLVVGGTSASTPEVAGVFSMINDARLNNGLPVLGFVNTRLYAAAVSRSQQMFVDITEGNSACGIGKCCPTGFVAAPGWDAFTGFGNVLYPGLIEAFSQ